MFIYFFAKTVLLTFGLFEIGFLNPIQLEEKRRYKKLLVKQN